MRRILSALAISLISACTLGGSVGCGDDLKTVKTIETQEQEPVRMVSPGTEVVE